LRPAWATSQDSGVFVLKKKKKNPTKMRGGYKLNTENDKIELEGR
jgi:hypothetical protein